MQEIWKDCNCGFNGYYQVSNLGRVKSMPRVVKRGKGSQSVEDKILKTRICKFGYSFVGLYVAPKKQVFKKIHRLVAEAFIDNPEKKKCVNHINGIKTDNRAENLEWATHRENTLHAVENKLMRPPKGESHPYSILKNEDVLKIRELRKTLKNTEISKIYNISTRTVRNVVNYKSWKHI